mgnify:CR=1 FL=1
MIDVIEKLFLSKSLTEKIKYILLKSGIKLPFESLFKRAIIMVFILSALGLVIFGSGAIKGQSAIKIPLILLSTWVVSFFVSLIFIAGLTFLVLNFKRYQRTKKLEAVLSDYLQLVSANLGAGMPIDQSLWYAIRDRFEIISEEMEMVAKKTMAGEDLDTALAEFAERYDSELLKRSIILLIEGLEAGGEVADLVNSIAWNIRETQLLKKEISSDVVTYSIFIGFASLLAAPVLFALSFRINIIMSNILSKIDLKGASTGGASLAGGISLSNLGEGGLSPSDFKNFAFISLGLTALISAMLISVVREGSIKAGMKYIPIFVAVSLLLFLSASALMSTLFAGVGL